MRNNTTPQQKAESDARLRLQRERDKADLRWVMSDPRGRRLLWRMFSEARMWAPCFDGSSHTYYVLGAKEFMLRFFNEATVELDLFSTMQKESQEVPRVQ